MTNSIGNFTIGQSADELVNIDLENIYKQSSRHSHKYALECIFAEGMKHANKVFDESVDKYTELKMKYESLLSKISASEHIAENNDEVQKKVISQALNMGKIFQK